MCLGGRVAQGEASDPNEQMELLKIKSTNVKLEMHGPRGATLRLS